MIKSFKCTETMKIWSGVQSRKLPKTIQKRALERLRQLDTAQDIDDLRIPPSNHLEKLIGKRKQQYSIRVNQKYRLCFYWQDNDAHQVEIVDYHKG